MPEGVHGHHRDRLSELAQEKLHELHGDNAKFVSIVNSREGSVFGRAIILTVKYKK